jgi:hypothetical protein
MAFATRRVPARCVPGRGRNRHNASCGYLRAGHDFNYPRRHPGGDNVKKLINAPDDYVDESLAGLCAALSGYARTGRAGRVIARAAR